MNRFAAALCCLLPAPVAFAQEGKTPEDLKSLPITTAGGKVGDLLRQWWKEGTAAGNVGDFYDNRDGAHSDLDTKPYPQLQRIVYTPDEIKLRVHWAAARMVRPGVVFGNSSTSAPPLMGGSNPRSYYTSPLGLDLLHKQYMGNNIYMYPEHRDHDPGHNGPDDGFGDLYPTNTPYLIISQGSSGSDQPFMRAVPFTLAAFRPEVKQKLTETGMLMPTVQMILRSTSKALKDPKEYLTGKAHPTVFEGSHVDELAMIQMAHEITADAIPPMVQVRVLKEDTFTQPRDYVEPGLTERLVDTPCVIARVWRARQGKRTITVSAEKSFDANKKPLKHHWVVLRGDAERIHIKPSEDGSVAQITLDYPTRRPIHPGAGIESNRVDIGVFVHNGRYFSAPAFVTFFSLDSETRTYDKEGRLLELGLGMAEARLEVKDWAAFFGSAARRRDSWKLLNLDGEQDLIDRLAKEAMPLQEERGKLETAITALEEVRRGLEKQKPGLEKEAKTDKDAERKLQGVQMEILRLDAMLQKDRQRVTHIQQEMAKLVNQPAKGAKASLNGIVRRSLTALQEQPDFYTKQAATLDDLLRKESPAQQKRLLAERQRLIGLGLATDAEGGFRWHGKDDPVSAYEAAQRRRFHGLWLVEVLYTEWLQLRILPHTVDPRLHAPRDWREKQHYDANGNFTGFTRWDGTKKMAFNRDGHLVLDTDALGRCHIAEAVAYEATGKRFGPPGSLSVQMRLTGTTFTYEYAGGDDFLGRVVERKEK